MPIALHSLRYWDWRIPEDEKVQKQKSCGTMRVVVNNIKD